jgi:hypothetical protein
VFTFLALRQRLRAKAAGFALLAMLPSWFHLLGEIKRGWLRNPRINGDVSENHSWLVVSTLLKNMKVSWEDYSQLNGKS